MNDDTNYMYYTITYIAYLTEMSRGAAQVVGEFCCCWVVASHKQYRTLDENVTIQHCVKHYHPLFEI